MSGVVLSLVLLAFAGMRPSAQAKVDPHDALLDMLVWHRTDVDLGAYSGDLRAAVDEYLRRLTGYRSARPEPSSKGLWKMVHEARVGYERRLVAASAGSGSARLAAAYVDDLRPCYEWEGYHDCPEREAVFAEDYLTAHPGSPFSAYLPLLAAHRWLCTSEAYEYEKRPGDASRARQRYEERIAVARRSQSQLVRTAAAALAKRGRCHPEH